MAQEKLKLRAIVTACSLAFAGFGGFAVAQDVSRPGAEVVQIEAEDVRDAADQVQEALQVVAQMEEEEGLGEVLAGAEGVFIVPEYGRAAFGLGARGGEGILMMRQASGNWAGPIFYNMGGISAGLQAGVEGGDVAFILNNDRAVRGFMQDNNWSLNADAGLTVVAWSAKAQANAGLGDVTVWSDTEGLFGDLAVSVTDINFDEDETAAYYGVQAAIADILNGRVVNPHAAGLRQALAAVAGTATGGALTEGATGEGLVEEEEGFVERGIVEEGVTEGAGVFEEEGVAEQGAEATGGMIEEGAQEVEQGAEATGGLMQEGAQEVEQGAEATGGLMQEGAQEVEQGAEATGGLMQEGAQEVEQGVEATGGALEEGAETTGGMIEEGVEETGQAIEQGAEATGNLIQEGAAETEQAIEGEEEGAVRTRPSTGY